MQKLVATSLAALLVSSQLACPVAAHAQRDGDTTTPIKHLVVIFGENISFDHYFGTYPRAVNPVGEPLFVPADNTPTVNGLSGGLLNGNLNSTGPFRLDRVMETTCDNDNHYADEQKAYNGGRIDKFPENTSATGST